MNQAVGLTKHRSTGTLILDFLVSITVKNNFLLFLLPSLWYSIIAAQQSETMITINKIKTTETLAVAHCKKYNLHKISLEK